jgi:hypothetical protein
MKPHAENDNARDEAKAASTGGCRGIEAQGATVSGLVSMESDHASTSREPNPATKGDHGYEKILTEDDPSFGPR